MTSRERLMLTLNHNEPDKIPHAIGSVGSNINIKLYAKLLDYFGINGESIVCGNKHAQTAASSEIFLKKLQCDVRALPGITKSDWRNKEWEDNDNLYYEDAWGTVFRMPKSGGFYFDLYKAPRENSFDNLNDVPFELPAPPAAVPGAAENAKALLKAGYPVIAQSQYGNGFLQTGPGIFGYEDWMMMLGTDDKRCTEFMDKLLENKIKCWEMIFGTIGEFIDVICEGDDLGTQNGPFIDPAMFKRKLKPYYAKLFGYIHSKTKAKIYFHSCGSVVKLIPDLIDAGIDILNPVQISAAGMEPAYLKKEFGKDVVFWGGGIDTQKILPAGTKKQIQDHVKRNMEILGKDGGFVFCTVHNVQNDVPVENFITMWETLMEMRDY